jgi:hypothetical protein
MKIHIWGGGNLPLAILNYRYNYIKKEAVSQNLVNISNGKMYDTPNRTVSPFGETTLFIATPMIPSSSRANVTFSIPTTLYISNQTSALQSIQVDLGDGSGYRATSLGQTVAAYYGSDGEKELKVKCTLANGQVFESHSVLQVQDDNRIVAGFRSPPTSYNTSPDLTQTDVTGCQLNYFFHCPAQGLQKPFVFIEGFDPANTNGFKKMLDRLGRNDNLVPPNQVSNTMLQRLYDEGYDLIYVDFTRGAGDIPDNAQVVKNVIRRMNTLKAQNGSTSKNRVLGASMGGVVGKWAIREMERSGENHDIDKYITFDSPMRGANVPMGIQFMLKDLDTREAIVKFRTFIGPISFSYSENVKISDYIPKVRSIKGILTSPAAKQLLFYNAFTPSGNPREFHDAFYAQLAALGDLNVDYSVVSNGSTINQPQLLTPGEQYVSLSGAGQAGILPPFFQNLGLDVRVSLDLKVFALPASGTAGVYSGQIAFRLPISGNLPAAITIDVTTQVNSTVNNLKPLDSAPGGFENFDFPQLTSALSFGSITPTVNFGTKTKGLWCFVPTFSALDMPEPSNVNQSFTCSTTNTSANRCVGSIDGNSFSEKIGTGAGGTAHNQDHVSINQHNSTFLLNQLASSTGLNGLTGSLTRTYNFGVTNQTPSQTVFQPTSTPNVISRGLTIEGTGQLWVNRSGRINYIDELNNFVNRSNSTFDLAIRRSVVACVASNAAVIVQNGGHLIIGDATERNIGIVHIERDATLDIRVGGTLEIENNSQLIIESGGTLTINAGANINLTSATARIIVRNGGHLIINGGNFNLNPTGGANSLSAETSIQIQSGGEMRLDNNFNYTGVGAFRFDFGHIFTLNTDLDLSGTGVNSSFIVLSEAPWGSVNRLTIQNRAFHLSNARVTCEKRSEIDIRNGTLLNRVEGVLFNGFWNTTALRFTDVSNASVQSCSFTYLFQGIVINSAANVLQVVNIGNCNFSAVDIGLTITSPNSQNIPNNRDVLVHDCTFAFTDWMGWVVISTGIACRFENLMQTVHFDRNMIDGIRDVASGLWENHTGVELRNSSIQVLGGRLHNLKTGISAEKENNNNVFLRETEVSGCQTGVNIVGGLYSNFLNFPYGDVQINCTQLIDNQVGIKGEFVNLRLNDGYNTFRTAANGLLFDICSSRNEDLIRANANFWEGGFDFMRFNVISGNLCSRGARLNLRQCVELQSEPTQCPPFGTNCCNVVSTTSDGSGTGVTDIVIQCLVAKNDNKTPQTSAAKKAGDNEGESVIVTKSSNEKWAIFPNPAHETVQLVIENGNYYVNVLNTVGQTIFGIYTEGSLSVDVSTWANGIYLFEVTDKATNKRQRSKMVVQH